MFMLVLGVPIGAIVGSQIDTKPKIENVKQVKPVERISHE